MRVPLSWLRELVDIDVGTDELAERLSATGSAVDKIERFAADVSGVLVAEVLDVADVPESDKLVVAQVDAGTANGRVTVLAGAKNFSTGDKVPLAVPGARVTTLDVPVSVRPMLKGKYESQGMLCSATELGVADDHSGILVLPPETAVGADVAMMLGLDDVVFEFEIYPNRPDQMSVLGIAREVSVLYGKELRLPSVDIAEHGPDASSVTSVAIEDLSACPRYVARVIEDVRFGASPPLVMARLTACGFRPLGNLVDATNYVLLLTGQPLHAFDLDKLAEERIVVRRARPSEKLRTLDDVERELRPHDLVIADAASAQALAGVMGGADSEVGPTTKRVLLESAYFDALTVSRTARELHMRTEASARFERGADPEAQAWAAAIAAESIRRWAGGVIANGDVDAGGTPPRRTLVLRPERIERVLGVAVDVQDVTRMLTGLGAEVRDWGGTIDVVAPSWRPDLEREIDLVEEVARLHGYDRFEPVHRSGLRGGRSAVQQLRQRARDALLGAGLSEATLSSFIHADDVSAIGYDGEVVRVANPMTEEQRQLRPSLFPGLLRAAERNVAHGIDRVRLFEFGKIFRGWPPGAELPDESEHVAFVLVGDADGAHWSAAQRRSADAFDAKGIIELLLAELGIEGWSLRSDDIAGLFHPGRSANVFVGDRIVGRFGEVRPSVARAFDLDDAVVGGLSLEPLFDMAPAQLQVHELATQPPVLRDIALALGEDVPAADVIATIRAAGGELLESVRLVDLYRGEQVGEGRKSLAFRLTFRAPDRTLTSDEADFVRTSIAGAVARELGADVR